MSKFEKSLETETMDLHRACRMGDLNSIKSAYEAQPDKIDERDAGLGWAPLYRTVICGHFEASKYLLLKGANPNIPNNLGETPLHQAADNSQYQMAELLISYGADTNYQQNDGDSPLHHASFRGDIKMIKLLLEHSANPNLANYMFGRTPLHYAVDCGHTECVKLMITDGADPEIRDKQGKSSFDLTKNEKMIEILSGKFEKDIVEEEQSAEMSSVFLSPSVAGTLSPISDVISYDFSELGDHERMLFANPQGFDTFGKEKFQEVMRVSNRDTTGQSSIKSTQINGEYELKPIFDWLDKLGLSEFYEVMVDAGYDDVQSMSAQMLTPMPITEQHLASIGISKAGHRKRIIMKLEEEAGLIQKRAVKKNSSSAWNGKQDFLKCCVAPSNATAGLFMQPTLREWLEDLGLENLYQQFIDAGYDEYENLVLSMFTKHPITHDVLEKEVKIKKAEFRNRILKRLEQDSKHYSTRSHSMSPQISFDESKNVACEMCVVM
ncbi:unnamed protein product [Blepharisma stoltei]|uniref:NAD(+) ADP-ribosyltransferase n=1 Tax=Blepharisma stoltei TaxID=1481888 RepID=A0AAU9JQW7_9CILI|nr:unnamed protein product [Blepharisma stoltei]